MSPRAAWRLERLGFPHVYDYVPGKMDWLSFNLPHEGSALLAGVVLETDVPLCRVDTPLGEARLHVTEAGASFCIVTDEWGLVAGVVQGDVLDGDNDLTVERVMEFGVTTVRPSEEVRPLLQRMGRAGVGAIVVTSSDGRFLGVLLKNEAEGQLAAHERER
jgi:CBS domain-containing protein